MIYFIYFFSIVTLQLEDKRAEMERQLISMKVQYQSLQKQHAFSKQQLQRMKVLCGDGKNQACQGTLLPCSSKDNLNWTVCRWLGAGPDSHSDAAPGVQGWSRTAGKTPVHAVWEKWRTPKPNDQITETRESGGKGSFWQWKIPLLENKILWVYMHAVQKTKLFCVCVCRWHWRLSLPILHQQRLMMALMKLTTLICSKWSWITLCESNFSTVYTFCFSCFSLSKSHGYTI